MFAFGLIFQALLAAHAAMSAPAAPERYLSRYPYDVVARGRSDGGSGLVARNMANFSIRSRINRNLTKRRKRDLRIALYEVAILRTQEHPPHNKELMEAQRTALGLNDITVPADQEQLTLDQEVEILELMVAEHAYFIRIGKEYRNKYHKGTNWHNVNLGTLEDQLKLAKNKKRALAQEKVKVALAEKEKQRAIANVVTNLRAGHPPPDDPALMEAQREVLGLKGVTLPDDQTQLNDDQELELLEWVAQCSNSAVAKQQWETARAKAAEAKAV